MTIVDSSVLIAMEHGELNRTVIETRSKETPIALAAITVSELLHGVHRARGTRQRVRREAFVEGLLDTIPVIPFDLTIARVHSRLWARLAATGRMIGVHDLQIGATAVAVGGPVATRDQRSFSKIPGLEVQRW